ncbi:MAG: heme A synthase [Porticoccaceae bacterium]|nr:MAG: heme A synthase [Porticoccaceae bacterium]
MAQPSAHRRKPGFRLAAFACLLAFCVVELGAFTRLVDAGLGCPDWPGCYGHLLWPDESHEIAAAQARFPDAPVDPSKTWPEMVHRYFAATLGLLIAALALLAWRHREDPEYPFRLPMLLLFLVVWQALFGMWTVTLRLWPQVVAAHLVGGMAILALVWLLANRLADVRWRLPAATCGRLRALKPWAVVVLAVVAVQIFLGGWTTANYAAFACPDFPTCHGQWWPAHMDWRRGFDFGQQVGPNYLGGQLENDARVAIHFFHRVGALVTAVAVAVFAALLARVGERRPRRLAGLLVGLVALQIGLGIANVLLRVPLPLALAHNAGAALLLLGVVTAAARIWMALPLEVEET